MTRTPRVGGAYVALTNDEAPTLQSVERRDQDRYLPCVYRITLGDYPAAAILTLEEDAATLLADRARVDFLPGLHLHPLDARALQGALALLGVARYQTA